jgi:hypothetical protein
MKVTMTDDTFTIEHDGEKVAVSRTYETTGASMIDMAWPLILARARNDIDLSAWRHILNIRIGVSVVYTNWNVTSIAYITSFCDLVFILLRHVTDPDEDVDDLHTYRDIIERMHAPIYHFIQTKSVGDVHIQSARDDGEFIEIE